MTSFFTIFFSQLYKFLLFVKKKYEQKIKAKWISNIYVLRSKCMKLFSTLVEFLNIVLEQPERIPNLSLDFPLRARIYRKICSRHSSILQIRTSSWCTRKWFMSVSKPEIFSNSSLNLPFLSCDLIRSCVKAFVLLASKSKFVFLKRIY